MAPTPPSFGIVLVKSLPDRSISSSGVSGPAKLRDSRPPSRPTETMQHRRTCRPPRAGSPGPRATPNSAAASTARLSARRFPTGSTARWRLRPAAARRCRPSTRDEAATSRAPGFRPAAGTTNGLREASWLGQSEAVIGRTRGRGAPVRTYPSGVIPVHLRKALRKLLGSSYPSAFNKDHLGTSRCRREGASMHQQVRLTGRELPHFATVVRSPPWESLSVMDVLPPALKSIVTAGHGISESLFEISPDAAETHSADAPREISFG